MTVFGFQIMSHLSNLVLIRSDYFVVVIADSRKKSGENMVLVIDEQFSII